MSTHTTATGLPTTGRPRTWKITTTNGITAYGYLPAWADDDPSESDLDPRSLDVALANIAHRFPFDGMTSPLITPDITPHGDTDDGIASYFCEIDCHPHADRAFPDDPLVPVLTLHITHDRSTTCREPAELLALIARLRAHTDYLAHHVLPAFTAIREDWSAHHRIAARSSP